MAGRELKIGVGLIVVAALGATVLLLQRGTQAPQLTREQIIQAELDKQEQFIKQRLLELQQSKDIDLKTLVNQAKTVYNEKEPDRKDGFLWVDRKASKYIVTLGALNGVNQGNQLTVYDEGEVLTDVTVDLAFDVISYVNLPVGVDVKLSKDYYPVKRE